MPIPAGYRNRLGVVAFAAGAGLVGFAAWLGIRRPAHSGLGRPIKIPRVRPDARKWLVEAVRRVGGNDPEIACRRALGPSPAHKWTSTGRVADEIIEASGLDFGALDPGSVHLLDEFCKRLELRGRCPARTRGAWRRALIMALGQGGQRAYTGLAYRPAWRAFETAFLEETGRALPFPPGARRLAHYQDRFADCEDRHAEHIHRLIADAQQKVPF